MTKDYSTRLINIVIKLYLYQVQGPSFDLQQHTLEAREIDTNSHRTGII